LQQICLDDIRGIEGIAAAKYFTALSGALPLPWVFRERNRRPPRDPINALLSFGYTLLLSSITTAAIVAGLDPCVGFLHPEYRGRPSLALDMMEEFRSPVIDRMVVAACNQGLFKIADFSKSEGELGINMNSSAKKTLLKLYDERLRTSVKNDATGESSTYETHIRARAAALAYHLRGNGEYLPFICEH
jgi:CRISPR-associated protein Cas1